MSLRKLTIHRSGTRPLLLWGGDRGLALFSAFVSFLLTIQMASRGWYFIVLGIAFWLLSLWGLRRMAKADPLLRQVYTANLRYRRYYPARSRPWRKNRSDFSAPF